MVRSLCIAVFCIALAATSCITIALILLWSSIQEEMQLEYLRFFLDAYKAVGIGFLVALLGVIIPHLLPEAQYQFQRHKESRTAYSQAKTALMYLPEKVACLGCLEAIATVQEAHEKLHLARTYDELQEYLDPPFTPKTWTEKRYWELTAIRWMLGEHADRWHELRGEPCVEKLRGAFDRVAAVLDEHAGLQGSEHEKELAPIMRDALRDVLELRDPSQA